MHIMRYVFLAVSLLCFGCGDEPSPRQETGQVTEEQPALKAKERAAQKAKKRTAQESEESPGEKTKEKTAKKPKKKMRTIIQK